MCAGQLAEADPKASLRHDYYAEPASGSGVSIKRAVGSAAAGRFSFLFAKVYPSLLPIIAAHWRLFSANARVPFLRLMPFCVFNRVFL